MDFLRNRSFRMTLLVRDEQSVNRTLDADRLTGLFVCASLDPISGTDSSFPVSLSAANVGLRRSIPQQAKPSVSSPIIGRYT